MSDSADSALLNLPLKHYNTNIYDTPRWITSPIVPNQEVGPSSNFNACQMLCEPFGKHLNCVNVRLGRFGAGKSVPQSIRTPKYIIHPDG
jgi:hypothetical protein